MTNQEQIDLLSKYFETILVDSSNGKLETTEVLREKRGYKTIKKVNDYNLIGCEHSLFSSICKNLNSFEETEVKQIKYLNFNLFQKLFYRKKEKNLIDQVKKMSNETSWLIIPSFLTNTFSKYNNFVKHFTQENRIQFGLFDQINILINTDIESKEIYFGNYNSLKIIINKNNSDFSIIDRNKIKLLKLI